MLFNSFDFAIFLPIVFILYWFVAGNNLKLQNFWILTSSYIFYGWWDWRFLTLIIASTLVDYLIGRAIGGEVKNTKRKFLLWLSLLFNLGMLGFFKYYNFFIENFIEAFSIFGYELQVNSLNIILPVGISFYTFQTMSYTIDVYRRQLEPTKDIIAFGAFVAFFPQLVAGPIERATKLLPQFKVKRSFALKTGADGVYQIVWGLFKKVVIADNCAEYANLIFNNHENYSGGILLLGAIFFSFQIYCDFSGYSDMAIGTAKLFGFNLMKNFATPYFSRDIGEFWRRWHISLSTWFRDYLYIPLGGSKGGKYNKVRNTFIIFTVSGFWHGANWTFIFWGMLNAVYFIPLLLLGKNRKYTSSAVGEGRNMPSIRESLQMLSTFFLAVLAWVFFRVENLRSGFQIISEIFTSGLIFRNFNSVFFESESVVIFLILPLFVIIDYKFRVKSFPLFNRKALRHIFTFILLLSILFFGAPEAKFIYFDF